jgi:hypothetical protein
VLSRIPREEAETIEKMLRDLLSMVLAIRATYIENKMHRRLINGAIRVFCPVKNRADEIGDILLLNSRQSFEPSDPSAQWNKYLGERTYHVEEKQFMGATMKQTTIVRLLEERSNCPFPIPKLYIIDVDGKRYFRIE